MAAAIFRNTCSWHGLAQCPPEVFSHGGAGLGSVGSPSGGRPGRTRAAAGQGAVRHLTARCGAPPSQSREGLAEGTASFSCSSAEMELGFRGERRAARERAPHHHPCHPHQGEGEAGLPRGDKEWPRCAHLLCSDREWLRCLIKLRGSGVGIRSSLRAPPPSPRTKEPAAPLPRQLPFGGGKNWETEKCIRSHNSVRRGTPVAWGRAGKGFARATGTEKDS